MTWRVRCPETAFISHPIPAQLEVDRDRDHQGDDENDRDKGPPHAETLALVPANAARPQRGRPWPHGNGRATADALLGAAWSNKSRHVPLVEAVLPLVRQIVAGKQDDGQKVPALPGTSTDKTALHRLNRWGTPGDEPRGLASG